MNVVNDFLNSIESRIPNKYFRLFGWIGLFAVGSKAMMLLYSMRKLFWFQKDLLQRYGVNSWVLITGGAKGLGRGFAVEFAKLGFNIIILDNDAQASQRLHHELSLINPNIKFKAIEVDFTKIYEETFFDEIDMVIRDLDISVLVNNVGKEKGVGNFERLTLSEVKKISILNILPQVLLSNKVIGKFLIRPKQFKSAIISMSSLTSCHPTRYWQLTAATKLFNIGFSCALSEEYENKIDVLAVKPGLVSTPLTGNITGFGIADVEDVVKGTLSKLGHTSVTHGYWLHALIAPFAVTKTMQAHMYNQVASIQKPLSSSKGTSRSASLKV